MRSSVVFLAILLTFISAPLAAQAQTMARDLNGFRLGQFRSVTHNELKAPDQEGNQSSDIRFEAFLLNEQPPLYMVFQYYTDTPEVIYSIQITGEDAEHDVGFRGLRLGMTPGEVEKILGKPSKTQNAGEHGTLWEFHKTNYSVEISTQKKLSSVRIFDLDMSEPDPKTMPKFADIVKILLNGTNAELSDFLAPDMELHEAGKARNFEWSMKSEIARDASGILGAVRRLAKKLPSVDVSKADQFEEVTRVGVGRDLMPVIRLLKLPEIGQITFRWNGERWQIWEFGTPPQSPAPQDWKSIYTPGSLKDIVTKRIPELIKTPNVALMKEGDKPHASFSYNSYPTSTKVIYTGETRKILEGNSSLIALWITTIGKSKEIAKRFEIEFKVIENGVEYWLPIQHPIPERLKAMKAGDPIIIYLAWVGIRFEKDKPELLAIVNEFEPAAK